MEKEYRRVFLDNVPWLADDGAAVFRSEHNLVETVPFDDLSRNGLHLASLRITVIKGYPYYHDERLKEFRRVGEPSFVLDYEQFDLLPEEDQHITVPCGEEFRKVMAKEKAYWKRRRDRDGDR